LIYLLRDIKGNGVGIIILNKKLDEILSLKILIYCSSLLIILQLILYYWEYSQNKYDSTKKIYRISQNTFSPGWMRKSWFFSKKDALSKVLLKLYEQIANIKQENQQNIFIMRNMMINIIYYHVGSLDTWSKLSEQVNSNVFI
jgi:hypothetical protein